MKGIPEDRALMLGQYIVEHGATVRSTAAAFGFSKSLVHKDVTERLRLTNHQPAEPRAVAERPRRTDEEPQRAAPAGRRGHPGKIQPAAKEDALTSLCFGDRAGIIAAEQP